MQISLDNFKASIKVAGLHKVGLHAIPRVHGITTKFYCDKLSLRSACSGECASCILLLKDRLNTTTWDGFNPYALYTHVVKSVSAQAVEQSRSEEKAAPVKDVLAEEVDVLDKLLETL